MLCWQVQELAFAKMDFSLWKLQVELVCPVTKLALLAQIRDPVWFVQLALVSTSKVDALVSKKAISIKHPRLANSVQIDARVVCQRPSVHPAKMAMTLSLMDNADLYSAPKVPLEISWTICARIVALTVPLVSRKLTNVRLAKTQTWRSFLTTILASNATSRETFCCKIRATAAHHSTLRSKVTHARLA